MSGHPAQVQNLLDGHAMHLAKPFSTAEFQPVISAQLGDLSG
jgi:hypothetical protein